MKREEGIIRAWMLRGVVILLGGMLLFGMLLGALSSCGHNPNHDINMERARAAANRVHPPPDPSVQIGPDHGG